MNLVSSYFAPSRPLPVSASGNVKTFFPSESLSDTWMCLEITGEQVQKKWRYTLTRYNLEAGDIDDKVESEGFERTDSRLPKVLP